MPLVHRAVAALPTDVSRLWLRRLLLANLAGQVGIVVTGGVVRLTGSGLGCPTFPECTDGSYTPVVHQPQGIHTLIEFGNRMLTFVVSALAVAALLAVLRHVRSGRSGRSARGLLALGALPFVGVAAQALIGGITVLTGLNPAVVAVHFLTSMALVAGSTVLLLVAVPAPVAPVLPVAPGVGAADGLAPRGGVRALGVLLGATAATVLVLGTAVTGSGPHSGDAHDPNRFDFPIAVVARLHSGAVWLFTLTLIALMLVLRRVGGPVEARRRARALLLLTVAQGGLGYLQYALGVPAALVAVHMLAAALFVVGVTATVHALLRRQPRFGAAPIPVERRLVP